MPRSGSQPTSDSVGRSGCGALKASCRQAPHKPALRVAFVPVTPPVVVPGQMPHVAYQNVRQKIAMANSHNPQSPEPVSHIHGLLESIAAAPARIAPERVDELKQLVEKHNIELHINDKGETAFDMGAMYGRVFTPMRVYHHLWSAALYFAALYIERQCAVIDGKQEVDLRDPDLEMISTNYLLSCKCFKEEREFPFPPNAREITKRDDYIELADEIFRTMVAFCLLHEIAHLEKGDSKTDDHGAPLNQEDPHEIEFAADRWAYQWILERWKDYSTDPRVFIKRTHGIIFSLAQMDEFRHHQGEVFVSSHPDACDRLLRFFGDFGDEIAANNWGDTCLTATYFGLQVSAWANDYLLPAKGYSDPVSFLKIVKEQAPKLAADIIKKKAAWQTGGERGGVGQESTRSETTVDDVVSFYTNARKENSTADAADQTIERFSITGVLVVNAFNAAHLDLTRSDAEAEMIRAHRNELLAHFNTQQSSDGSQNEQGEQDSGGQQATRPEST